MPKPFSLQPILELMQSRTDEATQKLARLIANERDAKAKLDMLQNYREEYAERFRESAQKGLTQREWQNFQQFLNRLDDAIAMQSKTVALRAKSTADGQTQWLQQRKKLMAFDTLSTRHFANENALEKKKEQKAQDELATRTKIYREK